MLKFSVLLIVPAVLLGLERFGRVPGWPRRAFVVGLVLVSLKFWVDNVDQIADNLREVPEWDFLGFWVHARTAVSGGNFYDPRAFASQADGLELSSAFRTEIASAGFWYPPPSMFLFLPLGWFDVRTALAVWYAFHIAVLAVCALWLRRIFFPGGGPVELAVCATLLSVAYGTVLTLHYAQTNFVALLALLLFWNRRDTGPGGAWAAAALFVKPFLAALAGVPLLARSWRAVAGFVIAVALFTLASIVAFGPRTFASYVASGPVGVKPAWIYFEETNQSALGWLLRLGQPDCEGSRCVLYPPFLVTSGLIGLTTLALGLRLARLGKTEWTLALFLVAALLVYPVSQVFYSVLLVPVLLLGWRSREQVPGGALAVASFAGVVYALCAADGGNATVYAFGLTWAALVWSGTQLVRNRTALRTEISGT
jgi:hypothetical protein